MRYALVVVMSWSALAACDPPAKATATGSGAAGVPGKLSAEHESCAASADCSDELRCIDGTCVRASGVLVADYQIARGDQLAARGQAIEAIASYRAAETALRAEEREAPPALLCGLGAALATRPQEALMAEEAAAKLHRCAVLLPAGSRARRLALEQLAALEPAGLDPAHLASARPVARYLTRAPQAPQAPSPSPSPAAPPAAAPPATPAAPPGTLTIAVTADTRPRARSFARFQSLLEGEPFKAAIRPCADAFAQTTGERSVAVTLPVEHSYRLDENDDFERAVVEVGDPVAGGTPALAAAAQCVQAALRPVAAEFARKTASESRWKVQLTLQIAI